MKKLLALTLLCSATIGLAMDCRFPRDNAEHAEATTKTPKPDSSIFGIVYKQIAGNPERLRKALTIIMENDMEKEETQTELLKALNFNGNSASTLFNLCNNEKLMREYETVLIASSVAVAMQTQKIKKLESREGALDEEHAAKLEAVKQEMAEFEAEKKELEGQRRALVAKEYVRLSKIMRDLRKKAKEKSDDFRKDFEADCLSCNAFGL